MTPDKAQGMVVGCLAATAAIAAGNAVVGGTRPAFRQVVGAGFVAIGLATVALAAPDMAAGFSVLILTSAVFVYGTPLLDAIASTTT